jgi:transcriptional regulator
MNKFLILCVVILFCSTGVFAQNLHIVDIKTDTLKEKPKYGTIKERFDQLNIDMLKGGNFRAIAEKKILQVGDSVRIKVIFNTKTVKHLAVENGGPVIPYKDLKKGEWVVTVKPEKTTNIRIGVTRYIAEINRTLVDYINQIFIVLEPDEYKVAIAKFKELEDKGDMRGLSSFLESLAGEEVLKTIRFR